LVPSLKIRVAPIAETIFRAKALAGKRRVSELAVSEVAMPDNRESNGKLGAILGALVAIALAIILLNGGEHFGKKTVSSDADLPPVQTAR
jgi:hypothetical protein